MSNPIEIKSIKLNALKNVFNKLGYEISIRLGQNEFRLFLNKQSKTGRFEPILTEKLFEVLELNEKSTITIEEFIIGFLEFEEEIQKNAELFKIKLAQEQEIYDKIVKQYKIYQSEKLNAEGFCNNAKIYGEITDIDIKKKLEGIKEIIIIVIYNEKREELHFKIGDKNSNEMLKKSFNFKPISRVDHFEFIMKGVNEREKLFDIGSKIFPLYDIISQEEYLIQIVIPEIENPNQIAAYINAKIILYMSDFKYYESLKKKQEKRLKKFKVAANKAEEYLKYVREIYGDLSLMKSELIVNFNNEKLMKRKGAILNVKFKNELEVQAPGSNYYVEYNNEREMLKKGSPLRIQLNNSNSIFETKKYAHKYYYSDILNNNVINDIERRIEKLKNERENINSNIQTIPKQNLEQYDIKKKTDIRFFKNPEQQQHLRQNNKSQPILQNINPQQKYTNDNVIQEQIKNSHQQIKQPLEPESTNSHFLQKIQQSNKNNNEKEETKIDIDSSFNQNLSQIKTQQIQNHNISNPQMIFTNSSQNIKPNSDGDIQKDKERTINITSPLNNNLNSFDFLHKNRENDNKIIGPKI